MMAFYFFKYASVLLKSRMDLPLQQTPAASYPRDAAYKPQLMLFTLLQNQMPDFTNAGNREQLFDREKLMMSCPESSAGSPTPWGLSLNNRMSAVAAAAAGPLFGEGTCQSRLGQRGSRCVGQSERVPAQQARDQEVKRHLE